MKPLLILLMLLCLNQTFAQTSPYFTVNKDGTKLELTLAGASHLASLPLKCIELEFPNKTNHTSTTATDHILTPKQLHPAFYGCFDWHSTVHGHWMLVRLLKQFPNLPEAQKARAAISRNINPQAIAQELQYFEPTLNKSFERTYGWAWLLKLQQELLTFKDDTDAKKWSAALQPFCDTVINIWMKYLPKQTYPNRTGVHPNTAFGLVLALDYARTVGNKTFEAAIVSSAKRLYLNDRGAPSQWEPDGTDFLSPSLEEADLMRRVLPKAEFITWFNTWISPSGLQHLTKLPIVSDRTDLQIVHLDGLCFSRSWCMKGIASVLPTTDKRRQILLKSSAQHLKASLPNIASGSYGGEHWLASFAVYALVN